MWEREDNQEVGLEAATLERKRNSSLVKWARAENVTGLKPGTEASAFAKLRFYGGVGEHCRGSEGRRRRRLERLQEKMPP